MLLIIESYCQLFVFILAIVELVFNLYLKNKIHLSGNKIILLHIGINILLIISIAVLIVINILTKNFRDIIIYSIILILYLFCLFVLIISYWKIKKTKKTEINTDKSGFFSRIKENRKNFILGNKKPKRGGYISIKTEETDEQNLTTQQ